MLKKTLTRSILPYLEKDLTEKFVFLAGPRQVGKTTISKAILKNIAGKYYNWDDSEDREKILRKSFLNDSFVILDELHKYLKWKNWIKGIYDKYHENVQILVTGSAKLDIYQKSGDSLFGRYFLHHLHPFSLSEVILSKINPPQDLLSSPNHNKSSLHQEIFENLFQLSGFPEPLFNTSIERYRRWTRQRRALLLEEELRDLTKIHSLSLLEHLMILLPQRAGSVLSITNLQTELQVAYNTLASWIDALARLYFLFLIPPYTSKISRTIKKEKKLYLWNWADIENEGARFENMVASHLLKATQTWNDLGFGDFGLFFIRDRNQKEVDFCITNHHQPIMLIETKLSETTPTESLIFYSRRLNCPAIQLIKKHHVYMESDQIQIRSASEWLAKLV